MYDLFYLLDPLYRIHLIRYPRILGLYNQPLLRTIHFNNIYNINDNEDACGCFIDIIPSTEFFCLEHNQWQDSICVWGCQAWGTSTSGEGARRVLSSANWAADGAGDETEADAREEEQREIYSRV